MDTEVPARWNKCPLHLQVEYQSDDNTIETKFRTEDCKFDKNYAPGTYTVGNWYTFKITNKQGKVYFDPNVGGSDEYLVQDYNPFVVTERDG
jgi:hypothetical protein